MHKDDRLVGSTQGDPNRTHGERLPEDVLQLLSRLDLSLGDVGLFAVCSGPGSFTGLRVGLATIQGLAVAGGRLVVGVPTLEALAYAAVWDAGPPMIEPGSRIVPWMNAHRGEVFGAVYAVGTDGQLELLRPPAVAPARTLRDEWAPLLGEAPTRFIGDAVADDEGRIGELSASIVLDARMPALAPVVARRAQVMGESAHTQPHGLHPVYVRRPDAELARENRRQATEAARGL